MVMSIYSLLFDSHVQDLHLVQSWFVPKLDCLQDDWVDTVKESVLRSPMDLSASDVLTFTSSALVFSAMLQVMLLVLMMVLACSWFSEDKYVIFFLWDLGGGFSVMLDCLKTSNLGEGGL